MGKKQKESNRDPEFEEYRKQTQLQFVAYEKSKVVLGPYTSHIWKSDPKHVGFVMARYKFVSKLLAGKNKVLEVGCGDAFGTPVVAKVVGSVHCIDFEPLLMEDNKKRLKDFKNITFSLIDITKNKPAGKFDAAFSMDVIEHLKPESEPAYFKNICNSLTDDGILIIGTPNITAKQYSTEYSKMGHINLKSYTDLRALFKKYFKNDFLFSLNDEMVHTGFYPMANYLLAVGISPKRDVA